MLSNSDKSKTMSDTVFAQELIREAFPTQRHGSVKAAQYAAYSYVRSLVAKDFTMRRVRSLWEGKARRIDNEEAEALRRAKNEGTRREYIELKGRLEKLEAALAVADQEIPGTPLVAHRAVANGMGGLHRPGT